MQIRYGRMQHLFETISLTQNFPSSVGEPKQRPVSPDACRASHPETSLWVLARLALSCLVLFTHEETNHPSSGCPPPLRHKLTPTVFQKDSESRKMLMMKDLHRGLQRRDEYVELKVGCM